MSASPPRLDTPQKRLECVSSGVELFSLAGGQAALYSAAAPEKATPNEDGVALVPIGADAAVLFVADGAGGMPAGAQASALAINTMLGVLARVTDADADLRNAILNGMEQANRAILETGSGASTTLAAVEIRGRQIRPYHVGDSMILITGQRGRIKLQTVSHSPVGYAVEAGFLEEREALHHEDRHLVSNMVGSVDMRIEIGPLVELAPYDTLLVASDGLFDNLHVGEIIQRIRKGPLARTAQILAADARQRMLQPRDPHPSKPDDLSFILYRGR